MGRDEVLEHRQSFPEIRTDRALDDLADAAGELLLRLGHQAAHARQLPDLIPAAAGARIVHHEHGVESAPALTHVIDHGFRHVVVRVRPGVDHLVVALTEGDLAGVVGPLEPLHPLLRLVEQLRLLGRNLEILDADRDAAGGGEIEPEPLEPIEEFDRLAQAGLAVRVEHQIRQVPLLHRVVAEAHLRHEQSRQDVVEEHPPEGGPQPPRLPIGRLRRVDRPEVDGRVVIGAAGQQRHLQLRDRAVIARVLPELDANRFVAPAALAQRLFEPGRQLREPIRPEHHVLRRLGHRPAVRGLEDVVGRDHQEARLELRLERQRHVHRHLIAVEVGVERRADQRMDPDGLALDQLRLERLNAQTVQRRRAVEQYRMVLDDLFQDLVDLRPLSLHDLLGPLDRLGDALFDELVDDERLEQLNRHRLRQPALMQPQLRADHDHRAAGVVHPLAQQVLTEPALLALEHVRQRLERALAAAHGSPSNGGRCRTARRRPPAASAFRSGESPPAPDAESASGAGCSG